MEQIFFPTASVKPASVDPVDDIDAAMFGDAPELQRTRPAPEMFVRPDYIGVAFDELAQARRALAAAVDATTKAKELYDDGERDAYLYDLVQGKNAEIRAASLASKLAPHADALRSARRIERAAELNYRIAADEVERVKLLVQVMSAGAGTMVVNQVSK